MRERGEGCAMNRGNKEREKGGVECDRERKRVGQRAFMW